MREKFRIGKFKNYIFLFLLNEFGIVSYVIVNQQEVKISNSKNYDLNTFIQNLIQKSEPKCDQLYLSCRLTASRKLKVYMYSICMFKLVFILLHGM